MRARALAAGLIIGGLLCASHAARATTADEVELGRRLATENCGACHATGPDGASPLAAAPAFRDLGKRYPVEHLEEALAEGIVTGHDAMPEIEWDTDQIVAFIAYLESIQTQ